MAKDSYFPGSDVLKNVLDNNLIGIFFLKPLWNEKNQLVDFEISYTNKKSSELFKGRSLKGKKFFKEFPDCMNSAIEKQLRCSINSGEKWSGEFIFNQGNVSLFTKAEIQKAGDQCIMMIMEIPGRGSGERIKEKEAQMEALLDNNPSLIFMKDENGRYVYLNKSYERQFIHSGDWYGKTDYDFWPEKSAELFRANDREVLRSGSIQQFIEDSTDKTGRRYCWMNYKFPFTDSNGNNFVGGIGIDATDTVIAEESLRASEILLREAQVKAEMLIKYAPTGIYELDYSVPKFLSVNDAMCKVTGYSREELLSMNPFQLLDKQSTESFAGRIRKILSGEAITENVEYKLRLKDGKELWTILNVTILPNGNSSHALVIAHDITERKLAEEKMHASESHFREIFYNNMVPMATWHKSGVILNANDVFLDMIGYSREELEAGKIKWHEITPPEYHQRDKEAVEEFEKNGLCIPYEKMYRHKDGHLVPIIIGTGIFDRAANIGVLFAVDLTIRKRAEKARYESEERFKASNETSPVGVGVSSMGGVIIYTNPAYERILGYDEGEIAAMKSSDLYWDPDEREAGMKILKEKDLLRDFEVRLKKKNGTPIWVSINTTPVTFGGKPALMETIQDISIRKDFEDELQKHNEELEERVRERTENLHILNETLTKSNKELENFAYIASHDLQEPLRMITSYSQLLEKKYSDRLDQEAKEYIGFAVEGAKRMYELINGLLSYSRIKRDIRFVDVNLNNVLELVRTNLQMVIRERNCLIESDNLPVVFGDQNQLVQLFQNLISNGIKFSPTDPHINISMANEESDYLISVKDNGIGIETQYFDRIFEIFKRLHQLDEYPGTGIGLAICRRIVENHGGRIWVESEPGQGSVFNFTLRKK